MGLGEGHILGLTVWAIGKARMPKTQEQQRVLIRDLADAIRKLNGGHALTKAEKALVAQAAAGAPIIGDAHSAFSKTYDELAQRLGLSRKTLQNLRDRHKDEAPRPRADGRHEVAEWAMFLIEKNVARIAENIPPPASASPEQEGPQCAKDWRNEELRLKCEKLVIENLKAAGMLLARNDVEEGMSTFASALRQALNNMRGRLSQKVLHLKDYHEAEEIVGEEIDVVLRLFSSGSFLDDLGDNATTSTAAPVIATPAQVQELLPDQQADVVKPARKAKPKARKARRKAQ